MMRRKYRLVILASGNGSNAESIMEWAKLTNYADIVAVISDKKNAFVLERAKKFQIPHILTVIKKEQESREEYDKKLLEELKKVQPDLILLAGFMRILNVETVNAYSKKILNIHPTLLPKYPGINGYEEMFQGSDEEVGCTVHYVDEGVDTGEIIGQSVFKRIPHETFLDFKARGLRNENLFYPKVIEKILKEKDAHHAYE